MSDKESPVPPVILPDEQPDDANAPPPQSDGYNLVADKIGFVPNIRGKDNLFQAICVAAFVAIGAVVGGVIGGWPMGILSGALIGIIAGVLCSGVALMVVGLVRKS
jgi:hypothetical protein